MENERIAQGCNACAQDGRGLVASVIIPVFNKERFLPSCVECLENQTMDKTLFEAIFIDDASTDGSLATLREMQEHRPWTRVLSLPKNSGVQAARNLGIESAHGRYIFFLDPDDVFSSNTLADVTTFFDEHADETDLVTYPVRSFTDGRKDAPHFRYKVLRETGVYNLSAWDNRLVCQTTMNICIANRGASNYRFDFEAPNGKVVHEDQFFIAKILRVKMSIGYCADASYFWKKNRSGATLSLTKPYYIWNNTIHAYENFFASFEGNVPVYFQAMLAHDLAWKMKSNAALPVHLHGTEREQAMRRLSRLLDRVDDAVLFEQPNMHLYHAIYFANLKSGEPIKMVLEDGAPVLMRGADVLLDSFATEMHILKTRVEAGRLRIWGFLKSPAFSCVQQGVPRLVAKTSSISRDAEPDESEDGETCMEELPLARSDWGRIVCKSMVAVFYDFFFSVDCELESTTEFFVEFNGFSLPLRIASWTPSSNFSSKTGCTFKRGNMFFTLYPKEGRICVSHERKVPRPSIGKKREAKRLLVKEVSRLLHGGRHRVWLYSDAHGRLDNAWIQFCHDAPIEDGVRRYYVADGVDAPADPEWRHATVVEYGSRQHMLLFYAADKILASDTARPCWAPLKDKADAFYRDLFHAQLVYLQHGVLWAHLPWLYSKSRMLFDRVVISTTFEQENLVDNYGFEPSDLIASGMPRYSQVDLDTRPGRRILLCPSWRQYLVGELDENGLRQGTDDVFAPSKYCREIRSLLASPALRRMLEEHDWTLDFQLHPNFRCYAHHFEDACTGRVYLVDAARPENYALAVTDYSSFSFDFLYLDRALVYFVPDYELFRGGVSHYNELDVSLEDAFGEFTTTAAGALDAIERVMENGGKPLSRYAKKTKGLFLHHDKLQSERLYEVLAAD